MATTLKFVTQYGIENVGSVSISSGTAANPGISLSSDENSGIFSPGDNILAFSTDGTERLRFSAVGAWGIAGANYGTSGQLLTSNGDGAAPSWQSVIPTQTGNGGKYLTTDGSSASWSVIASVATLADATILGTTANTAVSLKGKTSTNGATAAVTIAAGDSSAAGNSLTLSGGAASGMNTGGSIVIKSGDTGAAGAAAGSVTIHADSGNGGGAVTVRGGDSAGNGSVGAIAAGGSLTLRGGDSTNGSTGSTPGAVTIRGGNSVATTAGGAVTLSGGTGPAGGGALVFQTAATTSLLERMRIDNAGNLGIGTASPSALVNAYSSSNATLLVQGDNASTNVIAARYANDANGSNLIIRKYRGSVASPSAVSSGDAIGIMAFQAWGGTNIRTVAQVRAYVDTFTSDTDISSYLTFTTSPSGAAAATERFRITSTGALAVGGAANYGTSGQVLTSNGNAAPSWQDAGAGSFTGGTVANATTFSSSVAFGARYDELRSDVTATATTNFDCSLSNVFNVTLSASITSLTFSNIPASGRVFTLTLFLNQDATGSRTVTWPAAVKWPGAAAPTLTTTASKTDIITLVTHDGGTSWFGFVAGQNF